MGILIKKEELYCGVNAEEEYGIPFHGMITEENMMTAQFQSNVNHPKHYTSHPSGVECIQITEHMNFCLGNAIKYIWRAGEKDQTKEIEDLQKARWYLEREIARRREQG